jgi:hypothetical protein
MRNCSMPVVSFLKPRAVFLAMSAATVAGGVSSVRAALTLTISEPGFAPVQVTDAATPGQVSYLGSYGTFSTDIEVGLTNINTPTDSSAYLQLKSLDVTNEASTGAAADLTVTLAESTAFTFPGTPISLMALSSAMGGTITPATAGDTVSFQSIVTPETGGASSAVITAAPTFTATDSTGAENVVIPTESVDFTRTSSYTLENITDLSIDPGEALNVSGTTSVSSVPEPIGGSLLAAAAAMGLARRRRRPL